MENERYIRQANPILADDFLLEAMFPDQFSVKVSRLDFNDLASMLEGESKAIGFAMNQAALANEKLVVFLKNTMIYKLDNSNPEKPVLLPMQNAGKPSV